MCQPDTADYGLSQRAWVVEMVTATDSLNTRLRAAYNLQPVPEAAVSIVTDAAACAQAAQVMATKFNRPLYPVWLIRAGSNRYVVNDGVPVTSGSSHKYLASLVLDQNFAVLETITYKRYRRRETVGECELSLLDRPLQEQRAVFFALAIVATSACASVRVRALSMCAPDTSDHSLTHRDSVVEAVTGTDTLSARMRTAYNLPALRGSEVTIVTDPVACAQAAEAMATQYNWQQYPVVLIRAGPQRYLVYDGQPVGRAMPTLVLDHNFAVLEKLVTRP